MIKRDHAIPTARRSDSYPIEFPVDAKTTRLSTDTTNTNDGIVAIGTHSSHAVKNAEPSTVIRVADVSSLVSKDPHDCTFLAR